MFAVRTAPMAVALLLATAAGAQPDAGAFIRAARDGDGHRVHALLTASAELVSATDELHCTALDWAAMRGNWRIFDELLAAGSPVDNVGWDGGTVLHRACHHGRVAAVGGLLDAGAAIGAANRWGLTPLHVAVRRGHREVVELLLDRGADPGARSGTGWTPLHVARMCGREELAALLLARGADPAARDAEGRTPADLAAPRPPAIALAADRLGQYEGFYAFAPGSDEGFFVWREGDHLRLREFAPDDLYPTGEDEFHCDQEPWRVRFRRGPDGAVGEVEVRFPLRTVTAVRRPTARHVGSEACGACHREEYVQWLGSRHAAAYWRLATDWALFVGRQRPQYQDLENPRDDQRCLLCHVTGQQAALPLYGDDFRATAGVGCESCHGAGSRYVDPAVMRDRDAFLAAGGVVPTAATCTGCHRNPQRFDFASALPRIAHGPREGDPH